MSERSGGTAGRATPIGRLAFPLPGRGLASTPVTAQDGGKQTNSKGYDVGDVHHGLDLGAQTGTPLVAPASGVVVFAGWDPTGYGNTVHIRGDDGALYGLAHLSALAVRTGQRVRAGAYVGRVGETGNASGPHLHFQVTDERGHNVNPRPLLKGAASVQGISDRRLGRAGRRWGAGGGAPDGETDEARAEREAARAGLNARAAYEQANADKTQLDVLAAKKAQEIADEQQARVQAALQLPPGPERTKALLEAAQAAAAYSDPKALLDAARAEAQAQFQKAQELSRETGYQIDPETLQPKPGPGGYLLTEEAQNRRAALDLSGQQLAETGRHNQADEWTARLNARTAQQGAATNALEAYGRYGLATAPWQTNTLAALAPMTDLARAAQGMGLDPNGPVAQGVMQAFQAFQAGNPANSPAKGAPSSGNDGKPGDGTRGNSTGGTSGNGPTGKAPNGKDTPNSTSDGTTSKQKPPTTTPPTTALVEGAVPSDVSADQLNRARILWAQQHGGDTSGFQQAIRDGTYHTWVGQADAYWNAGTFGNSGSNIGPDGKPIVVPATQAPSAATPPPAPTPPYLTPDALVRRHPELGDTDLGGPPAPAAGQTDQNDTAEKDTTKEAPLPGAPSSLDDPDASLRTGAVNPYRAGNAQRDQIGAQPTANPDGSAPAASDSNGASGSGDNAGAGSGATSGGDGGSPDNSAGQESAGQDDSGQSGGSASSSDQGQEASPDSGSGGDEGGQTSGSADSDSSSSDSQQSGSGSDDNTPDTSGDNPDEQDGEDSSDGSGGGSLFLRALLAARRAEQAQRAAAARQLDPRLAGPLALAIASAAGALPGSPAARATRTAAARLPGARGAPPAPGGHKVRMAGPRDGGITQRRLGAGR